MPNNSKSPLIIGVSILVLSFFSVGWVVYSFVASETESAESQTGDGENFAIEDKHFEKLESEKNVLTAPAPSDSQGRGAIDPNSETGIPIGKYSNPPTSINSSGSSDFSGTNRPLDDFDSSIERNRLRQEQTNRATPNYDYNTPSSSNNFNRTEDNSLIEPLEEDSLETLGGEDDEEKSPSITPLEEPLLLREQ